MKTTYHNGEKPFQWSYSKLKNFETCPRRHYHLDIAKDVKEEKSDALLWGDAVHEAFHARLGKGVPFPNGYGQFEPWAQKVLTGEGKLLVENKLAITADFAPCTYFAKDVWFRTIADVIKIVGPVALVLDWKTGGRIVEDSVQLALCAACVFAHFPEIQRIRSEFIWLALEASSREDFTREQVPEIWEAIWQRITTLEQAYTDANYPPKPGGLCKRWCPISACPHHGGQ